MDSSFRCFLHGWLLKFDLSVELLALSYGLCL